jgi:hypothetical protein
MMFANIGEQTRYVPSNIYIRRLDARNYLNDMSDWGKRTMGADSLPEELLRARYLPLLC